MNGIDDSWLFSELESEPRLPSEWAEPLRMLIMQANVHPVRVAYTLEEHPELVDKKVEKQIQSTHDNVLLLTKMALLI